MPNVDTKVFLKNSKGVLYCSPKGSSEYAEAGKRMIYKFLQQNIVVSWYQFPSDLINDETDPIYQSVKETINKNINFDTVIFQCNPDDWYKHIEKFKIKFLKKKLIGYPILETNKVPELWTDYMNTMDEIWVSSKFNKDICEKCGVDVPIKIVPLKITNDISQEFVHFEGDKKIKINFVNVKVENNSEFEGIIYFGQYGTCGYATAAKGNLVHFFTKGIPITWKPLYFDNSQLSDECFYNAMVKSLINKPVETYNTIFLHSTPDTWGDLKSKNGDIMKGKKIIGYTVWETSHLPYNWVNDINENVDEVWCPSTYNETVFKNSGIRIPIKVFPHIFLQKELPNRESVSLKPHLNDFLIKDNEYYTFYNISELNPRKGIEDLVKVFCESFTSKNKVRLILKIHYKNYEDRNKKYCVNLLNNIVLGYKDPPKIYYILNNLSEKEILGLHSMGDCYVSLCKSEGFGLTIFEAYKYGKKVITTGYGGQLDFLGKNYKGLVQFEMGSVIGMKEFSKNYTEDQQWAYPNLKNAGELMKDYYEHDQNKRF